MKWLRSIDAALGRLLYRLTFVVIAALALGLLTSIALIVAGLFRISPFIALGAVGLAALLFYSARNSHGDEPTEPGQPVDRN